ncbi:hypothetical protein CEP52_015290 [Fusarium oligoseptatum]|uniref:AB hydrolase-1 domain-containing protein n=1 Tax=Fusarium oligoseptatum TaxID=2604345 RepID=A0A428SEN8_9HYPO|nr:hypothetical protein CEP52_015290 [Fusarium oligoseptatum]
MPFTTTDDDQLYYETSGDSGPTIVFIPGYMGIAEIWRPVLSRLGGQYRYVIYDTSYGRSSKRKDAASYSVERHALDINKPAILVAHSMGCNIASAFCLSNGTQVGGMVQVGAHYHGKQLAETGYTVDVFCGKAHIPSEAMGFYMRLGLSKDVAIEATKWPAYTRRHNAHALLSFELRDRAQKISMPTLIIQGGNDEIAIKKLEVLLNCLLRVIPNVNHFPPTEAPDDAARVIDEFVKSLPE